MIEGLKENILQMKKISREMYVFSNQLEIIKKLEEKGKSAINNQEKKLLESMVNSLKNQIRIINDSIENILNNISTYKKIGDTDKKQKLIKISYKPLTGNEKVSLTISEKDKKEFVENISKSNLSQNQLNKNFSVEKPENYFGKPNFYAKISNKFFKDFSNNLILQGYFNNLNKDLRKMNSRFVLSSYVSIVLFTLVLSFILSILLFILLLFFDISILYPFLLPTEESFLFRFLKYFGIMFLVPFITAILMYLYPSSEANAIGARIEQELPFVTIHMAAIATSGVEPISIFKIILRSEEYKFTNSELRKVLNLINFHGDDLVTALKKTSKSSPSANLRELLDGISVTITSGGKLADYLNKHAEDLLFDYRLERERYTKVSETFMDIYISIVIAAPMILLMLFVIMGSTGMLSNFLGLSTNMLSLLLILSIIILNLGFLFFLKMKQPII